MRIYWRGGTLWLYARVGGRDIRQSLGTDSEALATARASEILSAVPVSPAEIGLERAWKLYEDVNERALRQSTWASEKSHSRALLNWFRNKLVSGITRADVLEYRNDRLAQDLLPSSVNNEVALLYRIMENVGFHPEKVKPLRAGPPRVGYALTEEEEAAITDSAGLNWPIITLAINTGLRKEEVLGLIWNDVHLADGFLVVRSAKTDAGVRSIPLNKKASGALVSACGGDASCCPVGRKVFGYTDIDRWWEGVRVRAKMPHLRFHDLRHTFITRLFESGAPEGVIQDLVGHVSPAVTRRYSHIHQDARRRAVDLI